MFELKDLTGLGGPIQKLIEVVAQGIGDKTLPSRIRANADAQAYEIRIKSQAISEAQKLGVFVQSDDQKVLVKSPDKQTDEQQPAVLFDSALEQRAISRVIYQETNKQRNIENIVQIAAENLKDEQTVSPEKLDSDWTARFFNIVENITTEHMQMLWGKILAGEVKEPGSFSLRTLEVLKNLSKMEADTFVKVGRLAIQDPRLAFIPNRDNGMYIKDKFEIEFGDLLVLREVNLLVATDGISYKLYFVDDDDMTSETYICANKFVAVERPKGSPEKSIGAIAFTEVGRQLLKLVEPIKDIDYLKWAMSGFRYPGTTIKFGTIPAGIMPEQLAGFDMEELAE